MEEDERELVQIIAAEEVLQSRSHTYAVDIARRALAALRKAGYKVVKDPER